jgi:hypothetical protein
MHSPVILCPSKCVCWPDGEFTNAEQQVLETMNEFNVTCMTETPRDWVESVTHFLATCMEKMHHRRLAHLLSVPLRPFGWAHGRTLPFCFVVRIVDKMCPISTIAEAVHLFMQLPLCPHVGSVLYMGWASRKYSGAKSSRHPGRHCEAPTRNYQCFSLVHRARGYRSTHFAWLVMALGAYPVCGCTDCKVHWENDRDTPPGAATVPQWHRWWARGAKRRWVMAAVG